MKTETESTALAVIEPKDIQPLFTEPGRVDPILAKIAEEARSFVADVSTSTGRKNIASVAARVARTKTYLDGLGKELVDGLKELPKKVDANRKQIRDFLDALKDEVRQPLTEWEAEQKRIEDEEIARVQAEQLAKEIENCHEFALFLNADFDRKRDEERKAQEQLRAEAEARREREAQEKAQREAQEAILRAEREKAAAEQAKLDAEKRAREAEERAEAQRVRAEAEKAQAVLDAQRRMQERQENIKAAEAAAQAKREAHAGHRAKVIREVIFDLLALGYDEDTALALAKAIDAGKVRNVTVNY